MMNNEYLDDFIENALTEDIGDGDHTSLSCFSKTQTGKAQLIIKQDGVIAGIEVAKCIINKLDESLTVDVLIRDGTNVKKGDIAFIVKGRVISILQAERLILNIMQRMSGIATQTRKYVKEIEDFKAKILDTRKTTPGIRFLEKAAVKIGGGENHRMGLYDMIMLKDNHIDFAGGILQAIQLTHQYLKEKNKNLKIVIEVRTLEDVRKVLLIGGVDRIMLDNFSPKKTKEAVKLINGKIQTESSGGITLKNLRKYAECGVDFISIGALTHQIKSLDMSLKAI